MHPGTSCTEAYPTRVKSSPFKENFCPEVFTKPVTVDVGAVELEVDDGVEEEGTLVGVADDEEATPGRHCE